MGVAANRAAAFIGIGALVGSLVVGMATATVTALASMPRAEPVVGAPVTDTGRSGPDAGPPAAPAVPPSVVSALGQASAMNVRIVALAPALHDAVTADQFDTVDAAGLLRQFAGHAAFGSEVASRLAATGSADTLARDLGAFYAEIRAIAREGLSASLRNEAAYRVATEKMLSALSGVVHVDAATRALATEAGVTLPQVDLSVLARAEQGGANAAP